MTTPLDRIRLAVAVLAAVSLVPPAARAGVGVALSPASATVAPGSEFTIEVVVPAAGSAFNGFDAVIAYDPAALTFLPESPTTLQQGCLMTGACSAACGNTFHRFSAAGDSVAVNDVLLCNQISLTGPGTIYRLRFLASNSPQVTTLSIRRASFYNAGLFVLPVTRSGATIGIGISLDAPESARGAATSITAAPNPGRGPISLRIRSEFAGRQSLELMDVAGRTVRRFDASFASPGERVLEWDGRDASGAPAPAGVYLARLDAAGRVRFARILLLR